MKYKHNGLFDRRAMLLGAVQLGVGAGLVGRMAWLSVHDADRYRLAAEDNRVSLQLVPPRRGWIVDANGGTIASNRPAYSVQIVPSLVHDIDRTLQILRRYVPITADDVARIHAEAKTLPPSSPLSIASDIGWEAFAAINLDLADLDGLQPVRSYLRNYVNGEAFAHVTGYVGRATAEQYRQDRNPLYLVPGFRLGKDGIEKTQDATLRGKPGARRVEVNARGRVVRELDSRADIPGRTVQLTIDRDLQAYAATRVGSESCSVCVIDIHNGDIKCMLSMPAYDPNVFANRIPAAMWAELNASDRHPLLNKSIQGLYVPGSTFKPVTALAALAAGIDPHAHVTCRGSYRVGRGVWHCWLRRGHGSLDMRGGIKNSCNVFFYQRARDVGAEAVAQMARRLGFDQQYDLAMPHQRSGIIPDPHWKDRRFGKDWLVADTLNMAIGQGYVNVNPLQLAVMAARLASGQMVVPRLLAGPAPAPFATLGIPAENLDVVRAGMTDVVNAPGGTARRSALGIPGVQMAGKTGTAQVRSLSKGFRGGLAVPWKYRDHALFVAFAPVEAPRYAISVLVEHGIGGSRTAAPLAKDIMTWLFDRETAENRLQKLVAAREGERRAAEARAAAEAQAAAAATASSPASTGGAVDGQLG